MNLIVYHGVLAPNAKWRREVVDFGRPLGERASSATAPRKVSASYNRTWAELMRRDLDVLECPACGGRMRFVAAIMLASAIPRILGHLRRRTPTRVGLLLHTAALADALPGRTITYIQVCAWARCSAIWKQGDKHAASFQVKNGGS